MPGCRFLKSIRANERGKNKASVNSPLFQQASFSALLAIFTEVKLKNDMDYYEICYRNGKMTKDESMKAKKKKKSAAKNNEDAIFGEIYNIMTGASKESINER